MRRFAGEDAVPRMLGGRVVHRRRERGPIKGPRRASADCGQLVGPVGGHGARPRVPGRWSAAGRGAEASPLGGAPEAPRPGGVRPRGWRRAVPLHRGRMAGRARTKAPRTGPSAAGAECCGGGEHSRASSGEAQAVGRRRLRWDWFTREPPGRESVRRRAASAPIRVEERSRLRPPPPRGSARVARKDNFAAASPSPRRTDSGLPEPESPGTVPPAGQPGGGTSSAPLRLRP